jgi:hypothetical protein
MHARKSLSAFPWPDLWLPAAITAFAVIVGIYARFKGLGIWPFGVDEFYIARSTENILDTGLPEFACGGYYVRGLAYQYLVAGLRIAGLEPEIAGRLVTVVSSIVLLPAAYILGCRLSGRTVGMLAVAVLSFSVWEVEMARFARMYAPFQAVFAWYLVYFLKYTVDGDRSSLRMMVVLSVAGILIWEGGVLIALCNLLPPFLNHETGRLRRGSWLYIAGMLALFVIIYSLVAVDFRGFAGDPAYAGLSGPYRAVADSSISSPPVMTLSHNAAWLLAALVPACLSLLALRWIWSLRRSWPIAAGLTAILLMSALHQFLASLVVLVMLLLAKMITVSDLLQRSARWYVVAVFASLIFWSAFGIFASDWFSGASADAWDKEKTVSLARYFLGFPNVLDAIVRPWGSAVPILSLGLFIALCALTLFVITEGNRQVTDYSALLVLLLVMIVAISESDAPRNETRYAFFLYPVLILLVIAGLAIAIRSILVQGKKVPIAVSLTTISLFMVTEDLQIKHLLNVDTASINFRTGMPPALRSHYYPRDDVRELAAWLEKEADRDDIIVSGIPHLDQYLSRIDYFFLDEWDPRYVPYACDGGRAERWSNLPLLHTTEALGELAMSRKKIFVILYSDRNARLLEQAQKREWSLQVIPVSIPGYSNLLLINPS